jgi:uncharacterized surface protein with fasciclin (FAS1) repeats
MRFAIFFFLSCATAKPAPVPVPTQTHTVLAPEKKDLTHAALKSGKLSLFVTALAESDISGDFTTILAPTDDAFAVVAVERRAEVARHHVIAGRIDGAEAHAKDGRAIEVRREGEETFVDGVRVIARIEADNGVIWVINEALDPLAPPPDLKRALVRAGARSFAALLDQTNVLDGDGPFTVFAPLRTMVDLAASSAANAKNIRAFVMHHAARGRVVDLSKLTMVRALDGAELAIENGNVGGARVVRGPLPAQTGVVYVVDR